MSALVQHDYNDALRELQNQLEKGVSLSELENIYMKVNTKSMTQDRGLANATSGAPSSYCRRHDVLKWLQKHSEGKNTSLSSLTLMNLVEKSMGGNNVFSRQIYSIGNYEVVVSNNKFCILLDE